ncbi:MAG: sulfotransferase domain-containing protein [Gammaproteobacteria bacterium]|nr:sulfotransferase domain-containing protein [Gammaproteobacteria bacterium]MCZ6773786.1 sulfotransferase domain-containing protein [Pseudomonadota bacterium]
MMRETFVDIGMGSRFHWHCWRRDVSNFALLKYRDFDGFLVTMQHSGTHWLKYMMSVAIASQLDLPPPRYIHNDSSNDFIGHPKHERRYREAPRIASTHSIPHAMFDSRMLRELVKFPHYAILVRDIRAALVSNYEKWKHRYGVSFSEYLRGDLSGKCFILDIWSCLHFLNRWARVHARFPHATLILKYEQLNEEPVVSIEQIFAHFGIAIAHDHIEYAVAESSKEKMADKLNPDDPVRNIVRDSHEAPDTWFNADDRLFFDTTLARYLRGDFGYTYRW